MTAAFHAFGVPGLPEVRPGDDLAALILDRVPGADPGSPSLRDGDVLVVSSKIVSKAEGRVLAADTRDAAIEAETLRVVAERRTPRGLTRIVLSRSGPVLAAAGVDASNVDPGTVLLLPADPDASARRLRADLAARTGRRLAVVVSDTAGRPWRDGQTDIAIGVAGLHPVDDLRGHPDARGVTLEVTVRAIADELAAAADLVKGKADGVPVALLRGAGRWVGEDDGPGAAGLLRTGAADWFRHGHVEAVRAALGGDPAPRPVPADDVAARLGRACELALAPGWPGWRSGAPATRPDGDTATITADDPVDLGAAVARLHAAAWSEDLALTIEHSAIEHSTIERNSTIEHSAIERNSAQHSSAQHSSVTVRAHAVE